MPTKRDTVYSRVLILRHRVANQAMKQADTKGSEQAPMDGWMDTARRGPNDFSDRSRALDVLRAYGGSTVSFQSLESGYHYLFEVRDGEDVAVLAYLQSRGHRLVVGMPAGDPDACLALIAHFVSETAAAELVPVFMALESAEVEFLKHTGAKLDVLKVGEQPEWNPAHYCITGPHRRSLRAQINRARQKGVSVVRIEPDEMMASRSVWPVRLREIERAWSASRKVPVLGFMVRMEALTYAGERRYYFAEHQGRCVAFLAAVPIFGRDGWFFEDLLRSPEAPNGTMELLVHAALEDAREANDQFVTLGLAPLAGLEMPTNPTLTHRLLACTRHLEEFYGFAGLRRFKARFKPERWASIYVVSIGRALGLRALWAIVAAFISGGLIFFALGTIRRAMGRLSPHRTSQLVWALALPLLPWTLLLASADADRWFGDVSIKWAWVAFDSVLFSALVILAMLVKKRSKYASGLTLLLMGATLSDSVLSFVQGMHLHADASGWSGLLVWLGMLGPLFATLILAILNWSGALSYGES